MSFGMEVSVRHLDTQTLIDALTRLQHQIERPKKGKPELPEYVPGFFGTPSEELMERRTGMAIAAELWSRGVLTLTLPDVESVMREAERLMGAVE